MKLNKEKKYTLLWLFFFAVNIVIIAFIAYREFHGKDHSAVPEPGERGLLFLFGGFFCLALIFLTETAKCRLIMRGLGEHISLKAAFETVALGRYYDALMPTGGGGQPFQIYWLTVNGYKPKTAAAMPATYFITRQAASIFLTVMTFLLAGNAVEPAVRYAAYAGLFFCCIIPVTELCFSLKPKAVTALISVLIRFGAKLRLIRNPEAASENALGTLQQYHEGFVLIARNRMLTAKLLFLSLLCRIALCSMPFFVLRTLGCPSAFPDIFAATVYIYSAVTLIPTPGNSGVSEGAFYLVFSEIGTSGIFWAMLLWRLLCYYSFLLVGLLIFGRRAIEKPQKYYTDQEASCIN